MVDQLQDTHDHLSRAVEALVSGADWQRMLAVAARFHAYRTGDQLPDDRRSVPNGVAYRRVPILADLGPSGSSR